MPKTIGPHRETGTGPYRYQTANWKGSIAVDDGDLVYQDTGDATPAGVAYDKPAGSFTWATDIATTQLNFRPFFRGVSTVRRAAAQTAAGDQVTDGGILASGEFTFPCAALGAAYQVGALVSIAKASGNALDPKKVAITTNAAAAIGKLTVAAASGDIRLTFELFTPTLADPTAAAADTDSATIGASTAAAGSTTADAGVLPAGTAQVYPTTAANGTTGVRIHAADQVTGRRLFIGNGVSNQILKVYAPSGGAINGASADAAFSSVSGKGVIITCLNGTSNTWLAW